MSNITTNHAITYTNLYPISDSATCRSKNLEGGKQRRCIMGNVEVEYFMFPRESFIVVYMINVNKRRS